MAMNKAKKEVTTDIQDGIIASSGGLVVSGPKGSFQLDKNDSVIAGTSLGGGGGKNKIADFEAKQLHLLDKIHSATLAQLGNNPIGIIAYSAFQAKKKDKHYETKYR